MPARRRSMADLLAEQRGTEDPLTAAAEANEPPARTATAAAVPTATAVPVPRPGAAGDGPLSNGEAADLTTCEAALDNLRVAFWAAGKALQTVRDGRLYRGGFATFEDYVEQRWDMSRAQAYRLIEAWPLAERLSPMGDKLNERQVRELLPISTQHGQDAAAVVYETVAEVDGARVTAAVLRQVVGLLPADRFDRAEATAQIRAYLAGELSIPGVPHADPFVAQSSRLFTVLQRQAQKDPAKARQAVADLRAKLDEIEREISD